MADLTNIGAVKNGAADFTFTAGAASQTVLMTGARDEKFILLVSNEDAVVDAGIKVSAGGFSGSSKGSFQKNVAHGAKAVLGPFESNRFKGSNGKITVTITNVDGTAFSGSVTAVKIACIQLP